MRPKSLEIEGLQSFMEKQTIDFETLGETGLFGIFGPTGSGKSTILDAITFALYGRVKRAENGTQGIINSNCRTARVSFTFELSKDGGRKTYRIERAYQRKKNAPNSSEPKVARLVEITAAGEIPLCDRATEVSTYVKDLIGLNNEDFTRAVVLPQNSFHDFLMLDNKDRRGMLERIFYLEEYGRELEDKLKRRMAGMKSKLDVLSGELKAYEDASDEALADAQSEMEEAIRERSRVQKEAKECERRYNEAREVWGLIQEQTEFMRLEREHTASSKEVEEMRRSLDMAVKAEGLAEFIANVENVRGKLEETSRQLAEVSSGLPEMTDVLNVSKAQYEMLKKEVSAKQPGLLERKAKLSDALALKEELGAVSGNAARIHSEVLRLRNARERKDEELKNILMQLRALEKDMERLKSEIEPLKVDPEYRRQVQDGVKLKNGIDMLADGIKTLEERKKTLLESGFGLEQRLAKINEELEECVGTQKTLADEKTRCENERPVDQNALKKLSDRIHLVQGTYDLLALRKDELDKLKAKAEQLDTATTALQKSCGLLEEEREKAAAEVELSRSAYDKAVYEYSLHSVLHLSKDLKEGEPCPVCGSLHHPGPAADRGDSTDNFEEILKEEKRRLDEAEKTFREADRKSLIAAARLRTSSEQLEQLNSEIGTRLEEFAEERKKLPEKLRDMSLEEIRLEIAKANKSYEEKRQLYEEWEQRLDGLRRSLDEINKVTADKRLEQNEVNTELKGNRENIAQLENSLAESRERLEQLEREYDGFLQLYGLKDAVSELERLAENDRKLQKLQSELEKKQEEVNLRRLDAERSGEELKALDSDRIRMETEEHGLDLQMEEKASKLRELAGEAVDIKAEIENIGKTLESYNEREGKLRQDIEKLESSLNEMRVRKTTLDNQYAIYSEGLKNDSARLNAALSEKGFRDEKEAEASLLPVEKQRQLKAAIEDYDQKLLNIRAQLAMLQKKLDSRSITEEEWNAVNNAWQELSARKEACTTAGEVARNNYRLLKNKHEKWVALSARYNELSRKQGLYDQIQKLLKAELRKDNSFIDYIAEERLRYVAANASRTLGNITKHRYVLELDTEAGFIIRDQANGGAHRMVTSLSGGETFLVSLSLALALSEQIQLKGQSPLEFFFLDEGFGTLDQELLDTVIDSLERLSSRDRIIGLISHVPELRSRIGRRLVVQPPNLQGEGSKVTTEKA